MMVRRAAVIAAIALAIAALGWHGSLDHSGPATSRPAAIGVREATESLQPLALAHPTAFAIRRAASERPAAGALLLAFVVMAGPLCLRLQRATGYGHTFSLRPALDHRRHTIALRAPPRLSRSVEVRQVLAPPARVEEASARRVDSGGIRSHVQSSYIAQSHPVSVRHDARSGHDRGHRLAGRAHAGRRSRERADRLDHRRRYPS